MPQTQLRGNRTRARIGERFRKQNVAGLCHNAENSEEGRMRTRRDEQPLLLRNQRAVPQPMRCRFLVRLHPAKTLIAHQINKIAAERFQPVLHAIEQFRIVGLGRKIHRQIDDLRDDARLDHGAASPAHARKFPAQLAIQSGRAFVPRHSRAPPS